MVKDTIGLIELASIYKGYEVQDAILKSANVEKIIARTICSGKYLIIVRGTVADVEIAVSVAQKVGGFALIEATVIPNIAPDVLQAISGCSIIQSEKGEKIGGLLIVETFSVVTAIKAANIAVKKAILELNRIHIAMAVGGRGFLVITGNIASLESAVESIVESCKEEGLLAGFSLIKNPHEEVLKELI